jgi:hypothetical protein
VVGLATSQPLLLALTSVISLFLTLVAGHMLFEYLVVLVKEDRVAAAAATAAEKAGKKVVYVDEEDEGFMWDNTIMFLGGTTLIYDIMSQAVHTFVVFAGDAYDFFDGRVPRVLIAAVVRLILGLSVLGSISGLTLIASLSLFAPLQILHVLRGSGVLPGLRRRLNSRSPAATLLTVAFVAVGVLNSIVQVYDGLQGITQRVLRFVETQIVEVHAPGAAQPPRAMHPGWWERWWAERRWRTAAGWREVRLRAWIGAKEWGRQYRVAAAEAWRADPHVDVVAR